MKSYFQENKIYKCEKNRFYEMQSSSLLNITFIMIKNLYNARGKSKIRMQLIDMLKYDVFNELIYMQYQEKCAIHES